MSISSFNRGYVYTRVWTASPGSQPFVETGGTWAHGQKSNISASGCENWVLLGDTQPVPLRGAELSVMLEMQKSIRLHLFQLHTCLAVAEDVKRSNEQMGGVNPHFSCASGKH